jgi:hypothetical protein
MTEMNARPPRFVRGDSVSSQGMTLFWIVTTKTAVPPTTASLKAAACSSHSRAVLVMTKMNVQKRTTVKRDCVLEARISVPPNAETTVAKHPKEKPVPPALPIAALAPKDVMQTAFPDAKAALVSNASANSNRNAAPNPGPPIAPICVTTRASNPAKDANQARSPAVVVATANNACVKFLLPVVKKNGHPHAPLCVPVPA